MRVVVTLLFVLCACAPQKTAPPSGDNLPKANALVGYYGITSTHCRHNPDDKSCPDLKPPQICMQISQSSSDTYKVELFYEEVNTYLCNFNGEAKWDGEKLVAKPEMPSNPEEHITIQQEGNGIVIREVKPRPIKGYCGNHMDLNNVRFSMKDRGSVRGDGACAER